MSSPTITWLIFHDGIDIETYGNPDGSHALDGPHYPRESIDRRPVSIDFYNNYMTNFHDNAFEMTAACITFAS